jgi:hypothetical protein
MLVGADAPPLEGFNFDSFFGGFETLTFGSYPLHSDLSQIHDPGSGVLSQTAIHLEPVAYEIKQHLVDTAVRLATSYPENQYMTTLSPAINAVTNFELEHCLMLYFSNYHRHCPFLHRPTFQPTLVPVPLLLSIATLGAMYSPDPNKVTTWKALLDVIEAFVFDQPGLRDEYLGSVNLAEAENEDKLNFQFQVFQAAYLVVVIQYFSGNLAARRRARRQRFAKILSVSLCDWMRVWND